MAFSTKGNRFTASSLQQFTLYSFQVSAFDAARNRSARSTALSATTIDGIAPTVPTNVTALQVYATRALLTWTASTDNVSVNGVLNKTVPSNRAEITGLTQLSTHSIRIQAIDPAKNRSAQSAA